MLVRIVATTVSAGDWRTRSGEVPKGFDLIAPLIFGIRKPRNPILGTEAAGVVEAVGQGVTRFQPGDEVFVLDGVRMACHAEYKCMPETGAIARKPARLSFEQAAALGFGGSTALHFLGKAKVQRGESVLVNGASGSVGSACVQLAKHLGAEVTGVCSTVNVELVRSLGADQVIDYTREDFTKNGTRYDVIVDTVGTASIARSRGSLKPGGRLLLVFASFADMLSAPFSSMRGDATFVAGVASEDPKQLATLAELAETGAFEPVIDRTFAFDDIVEAHRLVDTGHKKGNVVVVVSPA
ncbi:MAG TPA: NAD(P)-dependent alcohol dehydrogenase [Polyangiaceae bacterium LLY-WYZ-14_1]|nr:NAD(P)-dependent alcohol dehydrogenase [Polyangiaceae bacterium LLY-WYZ-14_1]